MKFVDLNGREYNKSITASDFVRPRENRSRGEQWLHEQLTELFPHYDLLEEFPCLGSRQRVDFLILGPGMRYAFEFDGIQHNKYVPHFHKSRKGHADAMVRDNQKNVWCEINGIVLIRINKQDNDLLRKLISERTQ
ncbi:hypothetical protein KAR91_49840 [Candidatus Pacearchaeota archaeon]|nr:hypothetical protein [Candidatus Pacearchaeota archaeon]